jgi:hypothetical protein
VRGRFSPARPSRVLLLGGTSELGLAILAALAPAMRLIPRPLWRTLKR